MVHVCTIRRYQHTRVKLWWGPVCKLRALGYGHSVSVYIHTNKLEFAKLTPTRYTIHLHGTIRYERKPRR